MAEYGQTGKWLILPVKLCILLLGAYYIFTGFFKLGPLLFHGQPQVISINDTATILGQEPSYMFLEKFPDASSYDVQDSLVKLYNVQIGVMCVAGLVSLLTLFCLYSFAAYALYILTWTYAAVYFITHAHLLQAYQSDSAVILDHIPAFRGQSSHQVLFFGNLDWPDSFWYQYAAQLILRLYFVYIVSDLYYSWYLILKAGGSGWELLPANELPGWERYQARERQKLEERENARAGPAAGPGGDEEFRPEDMEMLLRFLQSRGGQGGGRPNAFGDVPPQMGIPVRPA